MVSEALSFHKSMKEHRGGVRLIIVLYLVHLLHSSPWNTTMIIFKCRRIATHFRKHTNYRNYDIDSDPLNLLTSNEDDKKTLCNAVINATQFAYGKDLRSRNDLMTEPDELLLASPSKLKLENCAVRLDSRRKTILCLRCVHTKNVKWFIAFGRMNTFMYLLEPGLATVDPHFRLTGLIEPRAVLQKDRSFLQFHIQFRKSRDEMEEICRVREEDSLRVCSVLFDALNAGEMPRKNNLQAPRGCSSSFIRGKVLQIKASVLPCKIISTSIKPRLRKFFLLADSSEPGAAFIFTHANVKQDRYHVLEMYARATGITALLYPMGIRKTKAEAESPPRAAPSPDPPQDAVSGRTRSQQKRKPLAGVHLHTSKGYFDPGSLTKFTQWPTSKRTPNQPKRQTSSSVPDPRPLTEFIQLPITRRARSQRNWEFRDLPSISENFRPETTKNQLDTNETDSDLESENEEKEDEENEDEFNFETTSSE